MTQRDIRSSLATAHSLSPATYTSDTDGDGVDLRGYDSAMVVVHTGSYTDGTHTFEVQESDDNSTFSAVSDDDLQGDEPVVDASGDADSTFEVGYIGNKRYIRVSVTAGSTSSGAVYGASVVRGHAHQRPA